LPIHEASRTSQKKCTSAIDRDAIADMHKKNRSRAVFLCYSRNYI
jgi:DNA primase